MEYEFENFMRQLWTTPPHRKPFFLLFPPPPSPCTGCEQWDSDFSSPPIGPYKAVIRLFNIFCLLKNTVSKKKTLKISFFLDKNVKFLKRLFCVAAW